jgi:hypothetical protein
VPSLSTFKIKGLRRCRLYFAQAWCVTDRTLHRNSAIRA